MATAGRPSRVDDDEIVAVLADAETPVLTTSDVAEQLPLSRRAVLDRLKDLHERGRVESMDVGPKAQVWWAINGGDTAPAAPLRRLVGLVDTDEADRARERSREWREDFDEAFGEDR